MLVTLVIEHQRAHDDMWALPKRRSHSL